MGSAERFGAIVFGYVPKEFFGILDLELNYSFCIIEWLILYE